MIKQILLEEDRPYPNSAFPVLYYPEAFKEITNNDNPEREVIEKLGQHLYKRDWVDGIFPYHHFHNNTHEVLVCIEGEASVQLGGPNGKTVTFSKGDVLLLPAGTAHKRIEASDDFEIVGAYPDGIDYQTYREEDVASEEIYEKVRQESAKVPVPENDPVQGQEGAVQKYWK